MSSFDGSHKIMSSIIYAIDEISITLRVSSPQDNDLIKTIFKLEITIIESDLGVLSQGELTVYLDEAASHGLAKPWIL